MRGGLALLAVAGCNQVLGIHDTHKADAAGEQLCDPLPFDPARYLHQDNQGAGYTWASARTQCQTVGMDLAVIDMNDTMEITNELSGGVLPFWFGVSFDGTEWSAIDTCTPVLEWATGQPSAQSIGRCVLQDAGGMTSFDCTGMQAGPGISALCETPRPSPACRLAAMQRNYFVGSTAPLPRYEAAQTCGAMGGHLVEIDSSDELTFVLQNYADIPDFWLGAELAGGTFVSPTSCPQIFTWAAQEPAPGIDCVYYSGAMRTDYCTGSDAHAVICEVN